jgi:diketogulonate reductase-like aldo/keto reductase
MLTKGEAAAAMPNALRTGYRLFDTAPGYGNKSKSGSGRHGRSSMPHRGDGEESLGDVLRQHRDSVPRAELFVTTKIHNKDQGYEAALRAFESSLQRLQLEYVDLLLVHSPCPHGTGAAQGWRGDEPSLRLDTWRACEELLLRGSCRAIGVSNYAEHHLDELLRSSRISPAINQIEISPFYQRRALVRYCQQRSIAVQAWGSLTAGQVLRPPKGMPWPTGFAKEKARVPMDGPSAVLEGVARAAGCTDAQVLLRWGLRKGLAVLPRSRHPPHIAENWRASQGGGLSLSVSACINLCVVCDILVG